MSTLLFDIEGTTTDIAFVHKVLFPYSLERIEAYARAHSHHPALDEVRATLLRERGTPASLSDAIAALKLWIRTDRKHGALKALQGEIWLAGYHSGAFTGHVYADVPEAWAKWKAAGHQLAIYSSGSVAAQKLIFGYSSAGDLTPLLTHYFDTAVGGKREAASYETIKATLGPKVTFFSDIPEELHAAQAAGFAVVQVCRDGVVPSPFRTITSFHEFTP